MPIAKRSSSQTRGKSPARRAASPTKAVKKPTRAKSPARASARAKSPTRKSTRTGRAPAAATDAETDAKWKKWWVRTYATLIMIGAFLVVIYMGHWALVAGVVLMSVAGFHEIETLMRGKAKFEQLPVSNRVLTWYWFALVSFYFHGRTLITRYGDTFVSDESLTMLPRYHLFASFCGLLFGMVAFVLLLEKGKYKLQFKQLAWNWMALFLAVIQASFWAANTLDGLFWIMFPASLVICNDVWAYIFGFFFGKTPLIRLSPKKTWEGFLGGGFATIVWALVFSAFLAQFDVVVCPREDIWTWPAQCTRAPHFDVQEIHVWRLVREFVALFGVECRSFMARPITLHAVVFALFASIVAPFGGFFASGFKRAFKLKDFADTIPGHGGILDRMDCQFSMGTWTALYIRTFISPRASVAQIVYLASQLSADDRAALLTRLTK